MTQYAPTKTPLFRKAVLSGLGNIGSQVIDSLGRLAGLECVLAVDPDDYSLTNLGSQRILRRDVGKPKAEVQARRLREINPDLEVIAFVDRIANVPRGLLRDAVVMTPMDSIAARRDAGEAAWRVGSPVVDGGVDTALGLCRVSVYPPGIDSACTECALDGSDYENMPARHVCGEVEEEADPTNGSPTLGSLVSSLMVIECEKLMAGQHEGSLAGRELLVDVTHHKQFVTRLDRNPCCRFDHARRVLEPLQGVTERTRLGDVLDAAGAAFGGGKVSLGVDGRRFARALHCPGCGTARELFALPERLPFARRSCAACAGREMLAVGFKQLDRVRAADVPPRVLRRSLRSLGVRAGDVLAAGDGEREKFFEVNRHE